MQRTFPLRPYTVPSRVLTGLTRAGLALANALEHGGSAVRRVADLAYGPDPRHRLDVYAPAADAATASGRLVPVVFLHGGNWTYFGKDDFRFVGAALAERGLVAFLPSFRRYPRVGLDAQLHDCARGVAFARRHAGEFGADGARVALLGHSSGAHLAALLALDARRLGQLGGAPDWLSALVGIAGPYCFAPAANPQMAEFFGPEARFARSQPVRFAGREAPPALLVHGLADRMVRPGNSRELFRRLRAAGARAELDLVAGDSHASALERWTRPRRAGDPLLGRIAAFLGARP